MSASTGDHDLSPTNPNNEPSTDAPEYRLLHDQGALYHSSNFVVMERNTLERVHAHLDYVYERHPIRRLRQSLMIVRHLLGGRG